MDGVGKVSVRWRYVWSEARRGEAPGVGAGASAPPPLASAEAEKVISTKGTGDFPDGERERKKESHERRPLPLANWTLLLLRGFVLENGR